MAIESLSDYKKKLKNKQVQKSTTGIESLNDFAKRNNIKLEYKGTKKTSGLFQQSSAYDDKKGNWFTDTTATIGSTVGDLASDIGRGFLTTTEGVADALQYGTAGVLDFFGADGAAKAVRENAKFNSTGAIFGENEDASDNLFKKGWAESLEDNSVIGDLGDSVFQGVGNVGAMVGVGALTGGSAISTALTSFTSAYGNARSQAYADGVDDKSAHKTALIQGFAEAISEQFFNGIPGMKSAGWGERLVGKIGGGVSKFLGSTAGKITMKVLDVAGEGAEEIISNVLTTTGNNVTHLIDKDFNYGMENSRLLKDGYQFGDITKDNLDVIFSEETWDAFISATLTSAIISGANTYLTTAQKNTIVKSYAKENGISIKEAKAQLKSTVNNQVKAQSVNLPFNERVELENKIQQQELNNMKNNTFVEQGQKDQAFQYKETDNEQVNKMLKNLSEKGNNTVENHATSQMAEKLIRDLGYDVEFTTAEELKAQNKPENVNGYKEGNKIVLNLNSNELSSFVMGHETTHFLEQETELYEAVSSAVFELAKTRGKYDGDVTNLSKTYENVINENIAKQESELGRELTEAERIAISDEVIKSELTANYVGNFFTDEDFFRTLGKSNPSMLQRFSEFLKKLYYNVTGQTEKAQILKAQQTIRKVYQEYANNNLPVAESDVQYALGHEGAIKTEEQLSRLEKAKAMQKEGKSATEIWQETGFQYSRRTNDFTYDIKDAKLNKNLELDTNESYRLEDVLVNAEELFYAYPNLKDIKIKFVDFREQAIKDKYTDSKIKEIQDVTGATTTDSEILLNTRKLTTYGQINNVLSHEIQHLIQVEEKMSEEKTSELKGKEYRLNEKELEAEISRVRNKMTDEQKKYFKPSDVLKMILENHEKYGYDAVNPNTIIDMLESTRNTDIRYSLSDSEGRTTSEDLTKRIYEIKNQREELRQQLLELRQERNDITASIPNYSMFKQYDELNDVNKRMDNNKNLSKELYAELQELETKIKEVKEQEKNERIAKEEAEATPHKLAQNKIIQETNPMLDDYHTGIRSVGDIKTWQEAMEEAERLNEGYSWGDFSEEDAQKSLKRGKIRVYSSYAIKNGTFVSTSYQQALDYAGGNHSQVHSREVALDSVAWISVDEGQYAKVYKSDIQSSLDENGSDYALYTPKNKSKNKLSDGVLEVKENLPVAEETKTEENLPYTEDAPVVETKEETKEVDLGEKSVLNNTINRNSIKAKEKAVKLAKSWLNLKDSNKQEFKDALDKYTRMSQEELLTGDTYEEIKNIVDRYSENEIVYTDEDVKAVKSRIRNAKIKVTEDLKSQITDYGYFRKSNLGKLKLGKEGTYIDVLWNELCEMYPHYFDSNVLAEADMLYALSDFMNEDNSITQKFTLDDADITEVTNDVFDTILDNALNKKQIESLTEKDNQLKKMNKVDVENIRTAESVIGNQEDYMSARAEELFTELKGLKSGVRASNELSRILNLGYRWRDIKAALSNIKWKPGMEVNSKNSDLGDIESTIKQMINEEYQNKVQDLIFDNAGVEGDLTKEEVARLKRFNYAKEVETLKDALESTSKELDKSIIEKQAEYDSKKNKDTATAQKLLQQISDLKIRKANIELDYNKRIGNLTEKVKNFDVKEETRRMNRAEYKKNLADEIKGYIENASKWIDKKLFGGFRYSRETAQRNMVDVAGDVDGNAINEYVFNPVQEHEASKNRRIKEKFKVIKDLNLNLKQQYEIDGEKVGEDDLVRRYIENSINKIELDKLGADSNKIIKAADTISEMLEGLFTDLNAELKKMGLPEVEHRKDYFPHGAEDKQDTFISKLAKVVGIDITNQELPTEIAGRTDEFKPNRAWNGHFLRRTGNKTNTDAIGNLEKYIAGVEDIIAHTEDIQKVRALSQEIRNQFTDEETQAKIEAINNNESLSDEERDELIKDIYKREDSQLSGLVTWLDDYANILSNKKSFADRDIERKIGRNAYTSMANIESMVAANTIGGNVSVSLTNFAPIVQAVATTKGRHLVKAALDVMKNDVNTLTGNENTSIKDMSDFLTNRFGTEGIGRQTWKDKIKKIAFKPMEIVDNFTSEVVVRAKYYENLENGMDTYEAIKKADKDAAKIMADRSKGALPTIFNEKNPLAKLITMFQVEPNNIISNYTKDMSRDAETKGQLAYQYTKLAIGSYVFNSILMGIRGGNEVLPDPIRFVEYLIKAITGDDDEREKAGEDMLEAVTSAIPFVSNVAGLLGMEDVGRIPISSALPDLTELVNLGDDEVSGEYKAQVVRDEILKPLSYFLLPTGAAQVWKTVQGIETVASGGSYKYAKDGELKMQFPVEDANIIDYAKAGLFGKYSLDEAKTYIDSGFKSLTEKQTQEYEKLNLPYEEYLEYNKGINAAKKEAKANDESQTEAVYDYIYNLPISTEQKNIMLNSALNNKDTITDDNGYIKYVNSKNRTYWYDAENGKLYNNNYHEVDSSMINELTQYSNEKDISGYDNYGSLEEFNYANNNPEKHLAIMQITDYDTYNEYKDYIEDISNHYSDIMDEATSSKQKTAISKQKKAAIRQYINSLNLNQYQKLMLEKLAAGYSIKNYKSQVQKYINSLELTYEEKQTIDSALFD